MGKVKWILLFGALLMVVSVPTMAGARTDSTVVLQEEGTTEYSATVAAYVASLFDGTRTAISISNSTAVPAIDGVTLTGFPDGLETAGPVWAFCYNTLSEGGPTEWVFNSADHPDVGTGLDESGNLVSGATWIVYNDELLTAIGGFDPAEDNFAGYCYFVGQFDAMIGTYINTFESAFGQQAFPLQSDFAGVGIDAEVTP